MVEGRRRLALLEHSLDPITFRRLDAIGVQSGWRCLDLGAGGGTVCEWLCRRVGDTGLVVGADVDARFLRALDHANLEVREENVVTCALPGGAFDLVHTRWTLMHIPEREEVLLRLIDSLKPGGTLFLEEPDIFPVVGLDRTGWHDVMMRAFDIVASRGSHMEWGRHLPHKLMSLGLADVRAESDFPYFQGGSELAAFWKISWGRLRDGVAATGGDVAPWDRELAELDDPSRLFVAPMTVAVTARKG